MTLARNIKRRMREMGPAMLFLALVGYFAWNATRGDLGLRAYAHRNADLAAAQASLTAANAEQQVWRAKVAAMQPTHLDIDALDERARQMLNLSAAEDVIVPTKK